MKRAALYSILLIIVLAAGAVAAEVTSPPIVQKAKESFFNALNHDVTKRKSALRELTTAVAVSPRDPETNLYLGLAHLWIAAEGDRTDPSSIDHVILSEHYLSRAARLNPTDKRIPSWLIPMQITLASIEGDAARRKQLYKDMLAAYDSDPNFHSFSVAALAFNTPRDGESFKNGLKVLRATDQCDQSDASCRNMPRWPHNQEGFVLMLVDYELRAGNRAEALARINEIRRVSSYSTWKFKSEVEDRLANIDDYIARYANDDPKDDPQAPLVRSNVQCQMCHMN